MAALDEQRFLLDTNVVSEWTKPAPNAGAVAFLEAIDEDRTFLSVVTIAELRRGVDRLPEGKKRERLEAWLMHDLSDRFEGRLLAVDAMVAHEWGRLAARAWRQRASEADALIAATASVHDCIIVTRNVRHFEPFGIELLNPWR